MADTMVNEIEAVIARQVEEGNYRSFDDALDAMKSILTNPALVEKARVAWLREEIRKGEESGEGIPAEEVFESLRARIEARH